jgi:hypothetical protein
MSSFSVELINGGDFQNVGTPIKIEANSFIELENNIKNNFDLDPNAELLIMHCGTLLSATSPFPTGDVPLFVSVKKHEIKSSFQHTNPVEPKFRPEFSNLGTAAGYIKRHLDKRNPNRERVINVIKNVLDRRWKKYPNLCRNNLFAANLCSSLDRFLQLVLSEKKCLEMSRKHELICLLILDIHRISQQKLLNTVQASPGNASTSSSAPSAMPFINAALGNPSNQSAGSNAITADMLQQALASAQASMQQTGQSTDQLQQTENRNLGQAAQEVVSEMAALAQAVDNGIKQLREMGILDQTTEAVARRILQENGGNVEAAINSILQ